MSPERALTRTPFMELETVEDEKVTVLTVLSSRPPTEPIDRPWPPEHVPPVNSILVPELIATQSSWFLQTAFEIVTVSDSEMSKQSVFLPLESPNYSKSARCALTMRTE